MTFGPGFPHQGSEAPSLAMRSSCRRSSVAILSLASVFWRDAPACRPGDCTPRSRPRPEALRSRHRPRERRVAKARRFPRSARSGQSPGPALSGRRTSIRCGSGWPGSRPFVGAPVRSAASRRIAEQGRSISAACSNAPLFAGAGRQPAQDPRQPTSQSPPAYHRRNGITKLQASHSKMCEPNSPKQGEPRGARASLPNLRGAVHVPHIAAGLT